MKQKVIILFSFLLGFNAFGQDNNSSYYTIAYGSMETGNIEIYSGDKAGESIVKSTNENGGYAAWSPDGKRIAFYAKYDDKKTWSIHTMNSVMVRIEKD